MHGTIWSLLPFVIVIPVAVLTKQVLPGLLTGLLVGAYMLHPGILTGIQAAIAYLIRELSVADNLRLIVFLYGFGAFVGLVRVAGGVSGFAKWMGKRVRNIRGAFAVTWLSSLFTFMAPDFRIITVAPVMKRIFARLNVPPTRVAFVIEATSTPFTAVVPIGTAFVGYMVGLIGTASRHQALGASPYQVFLLSILFNFFSIAMLVYAAFFTFVQKPAGSQLNSQTDAAESVRAEPGRVGLRVAPQVAALELARELAAPRDSGASSASADSAKNGPANDDPSGEKEFPDAMETVSNRVPPNVSNLVIPLVCLLGFTLFLTWWDGHTRSASFWGALVAANASKAMLEALLITLVVAFLWYTVSRQPISRTLFGFLQGGNEMMAVNVLLVLVWAVSAVSTDLGFTAYTQRMIGGLVPGAFIAPVLFVFGCLISYVIGSSFGTWGMLLPLGFGLAASTHTSLALIAGAVFASGTFGGFVSPLSDNTVAMATVMKLPVMEYAKYKLKAGALVAGVCAALYAGAGFFMRTG